MFRLTLALALFVFTPLLNAKELAKIGSQVITEESYQSALKSIGPQGDMVAANPDLRKKFLDHLINSRLLAEAATGAGIENSESFKTKLADIRLQLLAGEYLDQHIEKNTDDKALKEYFKKNTGAFSKKEVKAHHILVDDEAKAKDLLTQVKKKGADFEAIAKANSKDKTVDLGFFGPGRMVPEFEKAAFATPKGTIHPQIVKTGFGYHIIKVVDVKGEDKVDFEAVKPEVKQKLTAELQKSLLEDLRQKTKVTVDEEALKAVK